MRIKRVNIIIQVIVWFAIFLSPILYLDWGETIKVSTILRCVAIPFCLLITFYANYLWIVPRYFFNGNRHKFYLLNIVIVLGLTIFISLMMKWTGSSFMHTHFMPEAQDYPDQALGIYILHSLHPIFKLSVCVIVATLVRMSLRWVEVEDARALATMEQREAEIKSLRYQFHPHFLLNTLNNIYALTEFDVPKAQTAIIELSKMLRHILYYNDRAYLNLSEEVSFLNNYVNLMRLRLPESVEIKEEVEIVPGCEINIAPMLLISLIENAFKHGISPTLKSFIHLKLYADREKIECEIINTNHPKPPSDESGSGIGLQLIQRRLDLLYPGRYIWEKGTNADNTIYSSKITLYDTQLHHH